MTINCSGYVERPHLSYDVSGLSVQGEMVVSICVYMFVVGFWTFRRDSHEWTLFKSPHIISYILSYCMYQVLSYHMIYIMFMSPFVSCCLVVFHVLRFTFTISCSNHIVLYVNWMHIVVQCVSNDPSIHDVLITLRQSLRV
jgi:hypothetical protein